MTTQSLPLQALPVRDTTATAAVATIGPASFATAAPGIGPTEAVVDNRDATVASMLGQVPAQGQGQASLLELAVLGLLGLWLGLEVLAASWNEGIRFAVLTPRAARRGYRRVVV